MTQTSRLKLVCTSPYPSNKGIKFEIRKNQSDLNSLILGKENLKHKSISFAVESFVNETRNSSKAFEHLIGEREGNIIVRELTDEERQQLEVYKGKQTGWHFLRPVEIHLL